MAFRGLSVGGAIHRWRAGWAGVFVALTVLATACSSTTELRAGSSSDDAAAGQPTADQPAADQPAAEQPVDEATYLVFDPAPDGYRAIINEGPEGAGGPGGLDSATADLWGRHGADDPFVDGDLVMVVFEGMDDLSDFGSDPQFEIAGHMVQPLDPDDGASGVAWFNDQQAAVVLASVILDQDTVAEIATSFLTDGTIDPAGLDQLTDDAPFTPSAIASPLGGVRYLHESLLGQAEMPLAAGRPETYHLKVDQGRDPEAEAAVAAWLRLVEAADGSGSDGSTEPEPTVETVTVGDTTGELFIYPDPGIAYAELRFELADGTPVVLAAEAIPEDLVALAQTVRPANADEVTAMQQAFADLLADQQIEEAEERNRATTSTTTPQTTVTTGPAEDD